MKNSDGPSNGRYLIHSLRGQICVRALDFLLARIITPEQARPTSVRRLLIGIGGHIGDAVIASTVLPWLARALPETQIGIALSPGSVPVLEGSVQVQWIHPVNHWKLNRSSAPALGKYRASLSSHRRARSEIRAVGYDVAVDLYPYYPNMSLLFWRAGIPFRIGYVSGGAGPAYTIAKPWTDHGEHMAAHHRHLLSELSPLGDDVPLRYELPALPASVLEAGRRLLAEHGLQDKRFMVLHAGSGDPRKSWPVDRWVALARTMVSEGRAVVATGAGARDRETVSAIRQGCSAVVDLCDRTDLATLRFILRQAAAAVVIDSAAAHFAAAELTPSVVIMNRITNSRHWRPLSASSKLVSDQDDAESIHGVARALARDGLAAASGGQS